MNDNNKAADSSAAFYVSPKPRFRSGTVFPKSLIFWGEAMDRYFFAPLSLTACRGTFMYIFKTHIPDELFPLHMILLNIKAAGDAAAFMWARTKGFGVSNVFPKSH